MIAEGAILGGIGDLTDGDGRGHRHFWRYINAGTHEIKENRYEIAQLISCLPDEPRYIGDQDVFQMQEKVIENILADELQAIARSVAPSAVDPIPQTITETVKDALRRRSEGVDRADAKTCILFLGQAMGRGLHTKLKATYQQWNHDKNDATLVASLVKLAAEFGKTQIKSGNVKGLQREDLELICFEYISG